ncbi:protein transport protein S31 [Coemansia sp. RSA 1843]|nr:protein transport protein S31 [Coemansia sp. RSA 1843]
MVYQYVERTAIPAWGPQQADAPLVATGTVAGAMDASFSNMSELEIFKVAADGDEDGPLKAVGKVEAAARFQRLAWSGGKLDDVHAQGVLAGGLENGDVAFWNPTAIIDGAKDTALLHSSSAHTGAVGGLEFNPFQSSLMASGSTNGEVFIWDVVNDYKSYSPGPRSQRLDNITDLAWNNQVQHILATASNTGAVVVWDLRTRREAISFASPGVIGGGGMMGSNGGRAGISATDWNPASPTQLVTASSDDNNPVIMLWDLRNVNAPSQSFAGHNRGILSLSWCRKDSGLLLSSGKDNRTICWNPQSGEIVGELPPANNWVYDVQWNQVNPNLLSGASFDGRISLYTLSRENSEPLGTAGAASTDDPFAPQSTSAFAPSLPLKRPPKWLARPCGAAFGFGGKLVHFGKQQPQQQTGDAAATTKLYTPALVSITDFVSEPDMAQQAQQLEELLEGDQAADLCSKRLEQSKGTDQERSWQVLQILFESDARDKLIRFLGFDKPALKARIEELLKDSKSRSGKPEDPSSSKESDGSSKPKDEADKVDGDEDENPFANSASADPEAEDLFTKSIEASPTEATAGEAATATEAAAAADIQTLRMAFSSSFSIYDKNKDVKSEDAEGLVTRAVLLGDIEGAVELCIEQELFADALILATCGSAELATRAQQAYFAKRAQQAPYIRLLHGIVTNDLSDIARNAELGEWDEVLALLCTYAQGDQFSALCEVLGRRLEGAKQMDNAVLCYLASGNLDKVAAIWISHDRGATDGGRRARALHSLIEKVSVFRKAVQFIDPSISESRPVFPLAPLYDCYVEYAQFLAAQGLNSIAAKYLERVPKEYRCFLPTGEDALAALRNRLAISPEAPWTVTQVTADGQAAAEAAQQQQAQQAKQAQQQQQQQQQQRQYSMSNASAGYPPTSSNMPTAQHYGMQGGAAGYPTTSIAYGVGGFAAAPASIPSASSVGAPYAGMAQGYPPQQQQQQMGSVFPPPPQPLNPATIPTGNTPPPRRDDTAWNDPPMMTKPAKRAVGGAGGGVKPAAIVSPFPQGRNTPPPAAVAHYASARSPVNQQQQMPPPRAGFVPSAKAPQQSMAPPPPPPAGNMAFPMAQHMAVSQPGHPFQPQQPGFVPPPPQQQTSAAGPPGMAAQGTRGQVVTASPARTGTPAGAATAAGSKAQQQQQQPKFPAGDRSHIPSEWKGVYSALSGQLAHAKQFAAPAQKRMVDDADRRIQQLFDMMNADQIKSKDQLAPVFMQCVQAIDAKQFPAALHAQAELMSMCSDITTHLVGVKHLINVLKTLPV